MDRSLGSVMILTIVHQINEQPTCHPAITSSTQCSHCSPLSAAAADTPSEVAHIAAIPKHSHFWSPSYNTRLQPPSSSQSEGAMREDGMYLLRFRVMQEAGSSMGFIGFGGRLSAHACVGLHPDAKYKDYGHWHSCHWLS
jgi:hypothetical protein